MVFIWLGVFLALCFLEYVTVTLVCIWFIFGSVAAFFSAFLFDSVMIQLIVFAVVSAIALVITKPIMKNKINRQPVATNADRVIGQTGEVVELITPNTHGRVVVDNTSWAARSDENLPVGARCIIIAIEGVTLIVKPKSTNPLYSEQY